MIVHKPFISNKNAIITKNKFSFKFSKIIKDAKVSIKPSKKKKRSIKINFKYL